MPTTLIFITRSLSSGISVLRLRPKEQKQHWMMDTKLNRTSALEWMPGARFRLYSDALGPAPLIASVSPLNTPCLI